MSKNETLGIFRCRCCREELLNPIVLLKDMPLTDDFVLQSKIERKEYLSDIEVYECQNCGLVQNPADFDHEVYYKDYQYSAGHSSFTKSFMYKYAQITIEYFEISNNFEPKSVIEVGSGDGVQLQQFLNFGLSKVLGVEPSDYLARIAIDSGVPTQVNLFGKQIIKDLGEKFDICISSYTLDHVRSPIDYLETAHRLLNDHGILAFEVHNLEKIIERTEYCLFEHEHTIYLTPSDAKRFLEQQGFEVLAIDPIPQSQVRGNSLIIIAKKVPKEAPKEAHKIQNKIFHNIQLENLNARISNTISNLNQWIGSLDLNENLVGFGVGGRGVMTLAALENSSRFKVIFDSNYKSDLYLTPKTRIPVIGPHDWSLYSDSYCLIFSFGYFSEIRDQLVQKGFSAKKIISLADFFQEGMAE